MDDPKEEKYEIATSGGEKYLVFLVSLVKVSYAVDEAKFFEGVKMNLELRANKMDSFSRVGSFPISILANIVMVLVFLGFMYAFFPSLRSTAFVVFSKTNSPTQKRYENVSI